MSAGFKIAGEMLWGTTGAVEAYVETMAAIAVSHYGEDDPLTAYFIEQRDRFDSGWILFLDEWLADEVGRQRILELFEVATEKLLQDEVFTEYGRDWVAWFQPAFRTRIAASVSVAPESKHQPDA